MTEKSLQEIFAEQDAEKARLQEAAGGYYVPYVRPARFGWIGKVDSFKGSGMQLVAPPTFWRPTETGAIRAASRRARRWNQAEDRAEDRRGQERQVGL